MKHLAPSILLALCATLCGCKSSDTTDEASQAYGRSASSGHAADEDTELYWYQRGTDATKAIWTKYRVSPETASLRSADPNTPLGFWFSAQAFDLLLDSVGVFWRKDLAADAVDAYFREFTRSFPNRRSHAYNDDVLWWCIACTRAARITNNKNYILEAKELYDHLWSTQVDNAIGGGMWWRNDDRKTKNACVNLPAVIVALNLYEATKDLKYLLQGKSLYKWTSDTLFNANTGKVYDFIGVDGARVEWDFSCNSGVFVGASLRLFRATGKRMYLDNAKKAADYIMSAMSWRGVLKSCGQGDGGIFNGIAVRYLAELARRPGCEKYRDFLLSNANSAWTSRRLSDGVNGPDWTHAPQPGELIDPQTAISAGMLYFATSRAFR